MKQLFFTLALCLSIFCIGQTKKSLHIKRTQTSPKIDGVLDDEAWKTAEVATDFIQFRPEMGVTLPEDKKTTVKVTYDDNAIYFAAHLKDKPGDIQRQLTSRDNFGNSDFFIVVLNPNNDAQNDVEFFVFASGTQADAVASPSSGEDFGWNAVWDSAVKIVDDGWIVEMKIPYRALRFSTDVDTWGMQFHRRFRIDNTQYTWNPIDRTKGNMGLYHGELKGITNIDPPVRLNLYPFGSTVFNNEEKPDFKLGLDIKYGVTENFTLDATLIPDFSQASFDRVTLNLGPFEQTFGEQRQFFKEGVDLFNKGNLFFSRRIGGGPSHSPDLADDEETVNDPNEVKVLNALKLSGRTKKGLGIGIFNAITEKTETTIRKTEEILNIDGTVTENITHRKEVVEPFTNYNIVVVDQQFNGNSSVSLVNTNVTREGHFRDGNVTAIVADFSNKRNTYNIRGNAKLSNVNEIDNNSIKTGKSAFIRAGKSHGKFRFSGDYSFSDENYDINDLGRNLRNNFSNFGIDINYRIFEPTKHLNNFFINGYVNYRRLHDPSTFTGTNFGIFLRGQTKKLWWFRSNINFEPGKQYDYFEPRDFENKRYFVFKNIGSINAFIETNSNKKLSVEFGGGMWHAFDKERDLFGYFAEVFPAYRINDKLRLSLGLLYNNNKGSRGYALESNSIDDEIVFGERDMETIELSFSGGYTFNPFHSLSLVFRHYWTTVDYDSLPYFLQDDGSLIQQTSSLDNLLETSNVNFSTWNLDFSYTWQVAPGSFLTALYRNQLLYDDTESSRGFNHSISTLFDQDMNHIVSLRLQYFLDFNGIKNIFKKKKRTTTQTAYQTRPLDYQKPTPYMFGRP
jgi:hypothetical protein